MKFLVLCMFLGAALALPMNGGINSRIIGGQSAQKGQFPYVVAINATRGVYNDFCLGSLISSRYVLTTAHCIATAESAVVVLGAYNITDETEASQVRINAKKFIVYDEYVSYFKNDIALIDLGTSVEFSKYIQPVSLATGNETYAEEEVYVAGWKTSNTTDEWFYPNLNYVETHVLTNEECVKDWAIGGNVHPTHICTRGQGEVSQCLVDYGAPVVTASGVQVGITSFGNARCQLITATANTRVSSYIDWIKANSDLE